MLDVNQSNLIEITDADLPIIQSSPDGRFTSRKIIHIEIVRICPHELEVHLYSPKPKAPKPNVITYTITNDIVGFK